MAPVHCAAGSEGGDELRQHLACRAEGCVIQRCQIFLHRAACGLGITRFQPFRARNRPLLVGVRRNQAGIHRKTFSPDQSGCNTGLNDTLEDLAEDVTVTKPFIAGTRERRVIRNLVLNAQAAEPAIRQIDLDFAAKHPLRADRERVADDQHPDHQHRINRRPANLGIIGRQFTMHP
jgi:hypothetical protein